MSAFEPAVCNSVDSRGVVIELDGISPSFAVSRFAVLSCVATGLTVTKWEVVGMAVLSTGLAGMTENDRPSEPVGDTDEGVNSSGTIGNSEVGIGRKTECERPF